VTTLFPVTYGLIAAFRSFTNNEGEGNDEDDAETGKVAELSTRAEAAIAQSVSTVGRLEQQVGDLQRANDTRFADLHKDLAGIVWELSKLRADMARWQALAQLGARGSGARGSTNGTSPARAGSAAAHLGNASLPAPAVLPPDTRPQAAHDGGEAQAAGVRPDAAGARAWRSSGAVLGGGSEEP